MTKTKNQARKRGGKSREQARGQPSPQEQPRPIEPHPPRKNLPLLVLSAVLLFGFLIYLAVIAWVATH